MKTFRIITAFALSAMLAASCAYEYPMPEIQTDPELEAAGLQRFPTISIYDEQVIDLSVKRTFGVSKDLSFPLTVNEDILNEYNAVYGTAYKLMDASLFTVPENVVFEPNTQKTNVPVKVRVKELIAKVGAANAADYAIPLSFGQGETDMADAGSMGQVIVMLKIDQPTVDVVDDSYELFFVSISKAKQSVTLNATANFTTLAASKVSYKVDESKVAEYNAANGTSYKVLDSKYYTIKPSAFDAEAMTLATDVEFDCASIGGNDSFLIPLVFDQKEGYTVNQAEPLYVVVQMTDFKVWVVKENKYDVIRPQSGHGELEVRINAPIEQDLEINLVYNTASMIYYFASVGMELPTMDPSLLSSEKAVIPAGSQSCMVPYSLDLSAMEWDAGGAQWACLEVDKSSLPEGSTVDGLPAWFSAERTRRGDYTVTALDEGEFKNGPFRKEGQGYSFNNTYRTMAGKIWLVSENPKQAAGSIKTVHGQKYAVNYADKWSDGWLYFDVADEEIEGKPGCHALIHMQDRGCWWNPELNDGEGGWEGAGDWITYNSSYFDENNGSFYFDFVQDNANTAYEMGFIYTR